MIRHIIKLIWNRKRSLAWIFIEQMLVFIVLSLCFTSFPNRLKQHFSKGNIPVDNIVIIDYNKNDRRIDDEREANEAQFRNMLERMKGWQTVELTSINHGGAVPLQGTRYD